MLNAARVGHRYPAYRYEVSREKVREYALATGHGEGYLGDEAWLAAPPLFAACITGKASAVVMADPELGAHWSLVHGSQAYTFHRPVRVGDVLLCTPTVADITSRSSMEMLTIAVECGDAATGEPVVEGRSTLILLGGGV